MQKITVGDEYEGRYRHFSEMAAKWQPSWISQNAQECGDHTHRILNKDPLEGQNPLKTTIHHMFSRQTIFCLNNGVGHFGKWLPILSQVKFAMAL